ncbi:Lipopolysaccharide export system ATP-binding protein LptB [Thalassovita gelatinovora]|uniref:Lipopolysaccharide export system ATP-binding protein LptB n=1 Tax=Thalassovita gelatinovora TaxID=53501 RepID=A0A0P1FI25_THAGE|nr:ABC transporter ATP-binding protein [Thalassovita gelatinovora]QIZ82067.1 ABC transporter ATP-binding protein [Thalassovita gelatinovora]CUH67582.1 Lipopolysaccharide export system ATP-binding protein LptB [Thalassovita gelatinovora]SEP71404.1 amino acid/amide ABC transporter ATP-binding protein 1, HAAT family [Thalassovita gelatinovora]
MTLLQVEDLAVHFGGVKAVDGVSFNVEAGEVFSIIGPNGAGKSTIFNLISRFYKPTRGTIRFDGQDITAMQAHQIGQLGIARTFQNIELFDHSTVLDNLLMGRHTHRSTNWVQDMMYLPKVRRSERGHRRQVEEVIEFLELEAYRDKLIAGLPYGVRKVVEIGRALAMGPKMILLDEPASGLSVEESQEVAFWVEDMRRDMGLTVLMVEHDMSLVNQVSDRVLAVANGEALAMGTPAEVQANPQVKAAYLGTEVD